MLIALRTPRPALRAPHSALIKSCFFGCFFQMFDDIIFAFFSLEMTIKMVAMGIYGKGTYLADSWNRLDFFIVVAGWVSRSNI